jgi:hypothetical protein
LISNPLAALIAYLPKSQQKKAYVLYVPSI